MPIIIVYITEKYNDLTTNRFPRMAMLAPVPVAKQACVTVVGIYKSGLLMRIKVLSGHQLALDTDSIHN